MTGSCVLRETILKGRPRLVPRVSLSISIYLSMQGSRAPGAASPLHSLSALSLTRLCFVGTDSVVCVPLDSGLSQKLVAGRGFTALYTLFTPLVITLISPVLSPVGFVRRS